MTSEEFEIAIRKIIAGDEEGLREIYEAYMPLVFSTILQIVSVRQDAEDLSADFFIRLWQVAANYDFSGSHRSWVVTIARNIALDFARRRNKHEVLTNEMPEQETIPSTGDLGDVIISDMLLAQALDRLDDTEREIIHMRILLEMTFKEISEVTSMPIGTVTWRYQNAIKKLRKFGYG